jgi:hypothetical protein
VFFVPAKPPLPPRSIDSFSNDRSSIAAVSNNDERRAAAAKVGPRRWNKAHAATAIMVIAAVSGNAQKVSCSPRKGSDSYVIVPNADP